MDVDNEGMAARAKKWSTMKLIAAPKSAAPDLIVAANIKAPAEAEDLNIHHSQYEPRKPWFDSEASPATPGHLFRGFRQAWASAGITHHTRLPQAVCDGTDVIDEPGQASYRRAVESIGLASDSRHPQGHGW